MKSFYEALYLDKDTEITAVDLGNMIDLSNIKMFSSSWKKKYGEIEILEVLKNMKINKSSGSNGYTMEFFKKNFGVI